MCDDGELRFKTRILKALEDIDEEDIASVLQYVRSKEFPSDLTKMRILRAEEGTLKEIANSVKEIVPLNGEFDTELVIMPDIGDHADCNDDNTCHVDEFLFEDDEVDKLVAEGKLCKYRCLNCNSRHVKELIFISHSMNKKMMQYVFKVLLPEDLHGKKILDIGSRLGAVLYAAYHFTNAEKIYGVEKNEKMCDLQKSIIEQYSMDKNRIQIVHSDVMNCPEIVTGANVIIVNVLDFFVTMQEQQALWQYFKKSFKKDTLIITNRGIPETLGYLGLEQEFDSWITICKPFQIHNEKFFDFDEQNYNELFLYSVNEIELPAR